MFALVSNHRERVSLLCDFTMLVALALLHCIRVARPPHSSFRLRPYCVLLVTQNLILLKFLNRNAGSN